MKLVTGAGGFIASNLKADLKLARKDCDLTNYQEVVRFLRNSLPDTVIHCAAKHGSAVEMINNHSEYIHNNILSDLNIIKACKETGVKNLLIDLPSIDKEKDDGEVTNHKVFFDLVTGGNMNTITELIYVPNNVLDGDYLLNLQFMPINNDAAPSRPVLFKIQYL